MLMLCPICAEEFMLNLSSCPGCGCNLISSTLDEQTARHIRKIAEREPAYVELCRPRLYPVAMLIKGMLEQNGVPVIVQGGHSLSVMPHLAFGGELRVMVDSDQLEYARELYQAYFESDDPIDYESPD